MNIARILQERARESPEVAAIIDRARGHDRRLTFSELERLGAQAAAMLRAEGLRPGDTVLVLQPMSAELYVALLGLFRLGLVAMFLDPGLGREHIDRCCALRPPQAFIGSSKAHWLRLFYSSLRRIPCRFAVGGSVPGAKSWSRLSKFPAEGAIEDCGPDSPALITFTSGSTGQAKAVVRTHDFLLAQHRAIEENFRLAPGQIDLTALPIFVLAHLASGVTSVIPDADLRRPGEIDPRPVLSQIDRLRPTRCVASPAFLERLVDECERRDQRLDSLEKIHTGGGPVFPATLSGLRRIAPRAEVTAVYGSTEAEPIARFTAGEFKPDDVCLRHAGKGLLVGAPVSGIEVRIARDQWGVPLGALSAEAFERLLAPCGEPGEIVVTGAHVLQSYLDGVGDAETKFKVEGAVWHRTGDAGYCDADGRLWLLGRCSAAVRDEHGTVFPFSVECAAQDFSFVRRAAFIAHSGRRLLAVQLKGRRRLRPEQEEALCRSLAWARIDAIRALGAIPLDKRHNAKVDYAALVRALG